MNLLNTLQLALVIKTSANSRDCDMQYDTALQSAPNGTNGGHQFIYQTIHHETYLYIEYSPMNVR